MFWNIWVEGDFTGKHEVTKLNQEPIQAPTLGEAVAKFAATHPESNLFVRADFGWTFRGCMIFDSEITARVSQKAIEQYKKQ